MSVTQLFHAISNIGIKKEYAPWEISLTRKLNISSLFGAMNVLISLIIFLALGYYNSIFECVAVLVLAPLVFVCNYRLNYIYATWLFTFISCFLFFFLAVKTGPQSLAFLFYFPLTIAVIHMTSRKELYRHMILLLFLCLFSVAAILICYKYSLFKIELPDALLPTFKLMNIFFSFFTSIGFMFIVSTEAIGHEIQLKSALQQKEVLLAELFHRVKNNLNIITSLLNLKKNSISSPEAQIALEDCRNLVFSMALVHTKIYNSNKTDGLNFKEYLEDLLPELIKSIGGQELVEFEMRSPLVHLNLSQAIPCGLIVNELITNSFKHAQLPGQKLKIKVLLKEENDLVRLVVWDNGPGKVELATRPGALGLDLIRSLTEQLDGECYFKNDEGLCFNLQFNR